MDHRNLSGVGMGVVFGRAAMRRPAGVADADVAVERLSLQQSFQIAQLALARRRFSRPSSSVAMPAKS